MNDIISLFDENAIEYDDWFEKNNFAYLSEIEAVKRFIPPHGLGLEIGTGTGRFSKPFNITIGVEPARNMAAIAQQRGINVHNASAEKLPFCKEHFDFALMISTLCFVADPKMALSEAFRVLANNGTFIIGALDTKTKLGQKYFSMKTKNKFYNSANLFSIEEVISLLIGAGFKDIQTCQTIFTDPTRLSQVDEVKNGFGEGLFVAIKANK